MKNLFFYIKLFFQLVIDKMDNDELSFIIDDSGSHKLNKTVIRNIILLHLLFKKEVVIYKNNESTVITNIKSMNEFLGTFKNGQCYGGWFDFETHLNLAPVNSYKILYSDYYFSRNEVKVLNESYKGMLIANNDENVDKTVTTKKIHLLN